MYLLWCEREAGVPQQALLGDIALRILVGE